MTEKIDRANAKPNVFQGDVRSQYGDVIADGFQLNGDGEVQKALVLDVATIRGTTSKDLGVSLPKGARIVGCRSVIRTSGGGSIDIGTASDGDAYVDGLVVATGVNYAGNAQVNEANWLTPATDDVPLFGNTASSTSSAAGVVILEYVI